MAAPFCFGADAPRQQAQAQFLDHAEFLCADCFFGPSKYYYCFAAGNTVLVGYQRTPVMNYQDQSKNYLTKVRPRWEAWTAPGETVPISYDEKHIWVTRADGKDPSRSFGSKLKAAGMWMTRGDRKEVKLTRSSLGDIFTHDSRCREAGAAKTD